MAGELDPIVPHQNVDPAMLAGMGSVAVPDWEHLITWEGEGGAPEPELGDTVGPSPA